jgi:hypothetical protein
MKQPLPEVNNQSNDMLRMLHSPLPEQPVLADISVVIPTLGRPILESCLFWLADGTHWPDRIIIVDQGRNPVVAEWLGRLREAGLDTLYVPSEQHGRSAGINRGLEQVQTRFVAITHNDCWSDQSYLNC